MKEDGQVKSAGRLSSCGEKHTLMLLQEVIKGSPVEM